MASKSSVKIRYGQCNLVRRAAKEAYSYQQKTFMRRSNCSTPRAPPGHHFLGGCPVLFITLFLPCPAPINHFNTLILECHTLFSLHFPVPRSFLSHKFFLRPWGCPRGGMGSEQFDRRISCTYCKKGFIREERLKIHKRICEKKPLQLCKLVAG